MLCSVRAHPTGNSQILIIFSQYWKKKKIYFQLHFSGSCPVLSQSSKNFLENWLCVWSLMFKNFSLQPWLPKVPLASGLHPPTVSAFTWAMLSTQVPPCGQNWQVLPGETAAFCPCALYDSLLSWILLLVLFASAAIGCIQIDAFCEIFLVVLR